MHVLGERRVWSCGQGYGNSTTSSACWYGSLVSCVFSQLPEFDRAGQFIRSGWLVCFPLWDLAPSMELPCRSIKVRGFCPVAFLAPRAGDRCGDFSFCGCLAALWGVVTEHVREIRKNSETVHMQIPSITYVWFYCFSLVISWLKIPFSPVSIICFLRVKCHLCVAEGH